MTASSDDEQKGAVDAALRAWRQGDCVLGEHWFVHRFDPDRPLTRAAAEAATDGADLTEDEVVGFTVLSQTCDIVRDCANRPYLEIAPLVRVDAENLRSIQRGRRPSYVGIPGVQGRFLVADLDRVMTVEKAVVAGWERIAGCLNDEEARALAQALARKRARWAFPDDFAAFAGRLQRRLQKKHDMKNSDEGAGLRALREIRVRAAPSWEDASVELMFWFIRQDGQPDFRGLSWAELLKSWLELVPAHGRYSPVSGQVVTLDDLTARDYVESDPLDLDHLSSR